MTGIIIMPLIAIYGYSTQRFWPEGFIRIVVIAAILTALSVASAWLNPQPLWTEAEKATVLMPMVIVGNFLVKLIVTAIAFLIGFGLGRRRARKARRNGQSD